MFTGFGYAPCPHCGASIPHAEMADHECDPERILDYQAYVAAQELMSELADWLDSLEARFLLYCARRREPRRGLSRFSRSAA